MYIVGVLEEDKNLYRIFLQKNNLYQTCYFVGVIKKLNISCNNLKITNKYTYNFNQKLNFMKKKKRCV